MDEATLIASARTDPDAFAELYDRTFGQVYAFVYSLVRDHAMAEELAAETYHRAIARFDRYEDRGHPFATWLFAIARNLVRDMGRRSGREIPLLDHDRSEAVFPGAALLEAERGAAVRRAVARLGPDQREVVVLRFGHELSCRDVAKRMGRTEPAVKQLTYRAVQRLRQLLQEDGYEPND